MTAKLDNLASFLPDWNSLDSVRGAHSHLELTAITLFALLALFDILAHFSENRSIKWSTWFERIGLVFFFFAVSAELAGYGYGQRNDELSEGEIRSLSAVAAQAKADAGTALKDSAAAVTNSGQAVLDSASAKTVAGIAQTKSAAANVASDTALAEATSARGDIASARTQLEAATEELKLLGPRYALFVGKARDDFRATVKPFAGQKVLIRARANAGVEERMLEQQIWVSLPGWDVKTDNTSPFWSPEVNLGVSKKTASGATLKAAAALAKGLAAIGVGDVNGENPLRIEDFPDLPTDTIAVMIGEHIARNGRALDGASK